MREGGGGGGGGMRKGRKRGRKLICDLKTVNEW